jgi:hypothetical protein
MPFNPNKNSWAQNPGVTDLTAASGTADGVIDDVTGAHSQTILNNNFKEIQVTLAAILKALRDANIISG